MKSRPFGPSRIDLPVIGQGTWMMERGDRASAIAALRRGIDLGMTHIDTAELYGSGAVEEIVGEAIAGRRDEIFLVSKVMPSNASRSGTIASCEASLNRLGTDVLDLYLLHWPGTHPLEETIEAFEQLISDGKIRSWGLSNFDVEGLSEAESIAGPGRIACNQVLYHLKERFIEHELIDWCSQRNISVVAYSPFGSGEFPSPRSPQGKVLQRIADAHEATPHQVALAFLTRTPEVFAIPKASRVAHVEQNAGATNVVLTSAEIAELDRFFPMGDADRELPVI